MLRGTLTQEQLAAIQDRVARTLFEEFSGDHHGDKRAPWQQDKWMEPANRVIKTIFSMAEGKEPSKRTAHMTAAELANQLQQCPDAIVLVKVGNDWVEVRGVIGTGEHRNAVTFKVTEDMGGVSGVIAYTNDAC